MARQGGLTVVGETLVDLIIDHEAAEPVARLGGSPANVAVGLARLGTPSCLVTQTGTDDYGRFARARLVAEGVRVIEAGTAGPASTARAVLDQRGAATYTFSMRWDVAGIRIPADSTVVHAGSLGLLLRPGRDAVLRLLIDTARRGDLLISLDPNIRAELADDPSAARQAIRHAARLAHVVKLSDEDLDFLFPGVQPHRAGQVLIGGSARTALVVVTIGSAGALACTDVEVAHIPPFSVAVVDTVGAGDAVMSGLLDGLTGEAMRVSSPRELTEVLRSGMRPVREVVTRAMAAAAITCSRRGSDPPTAAELSQFLAARR